MRKFFILTLMVASLMMVSCVERRNQVILDKFVPILADDNCELKTGGDKYYTEGVIDLAFTNDYKLGFQITNHIPSSDGGGSDLTTSETNYFYARKAEINYEWDPRPQQDGSSLRGQMKQELWNKKTREMSQDVVVDPNGGQVVSYIHLFERLQIENLLDAYLAVPTFDWIASPLQITVRIFGTLADGTEVKTNRLYFSIIPTFGTTVQMGSVYPVPEGGFQETTDENGKKVSAEKAQYDTIMNYCAFNDALINGCFYGQDYSSVNCWAGDTEWERYIADTYWESNYTGYAAADVVEMVYNTRKKVAGDSNYYICCPGEAPEEPEEEEEEEENAAAAGGE